MDDLDPEIQAMAKTAQALSSLDEPSQHRVIAWLSEKYGVANRLVKVRDETPAKSDKDEPVSPSQKEFTEFAEMFNVFNPGSDAEKLLVGAYWLQVIEGSDSWYSVGINKLIKPTGHGIGKISRVLSTELKQKPAKIIQIKRTGSNQQAKKACKLTSEGIKFVESRLKD